MTYTDPGDEQPTTPFEPPVTPFKIHAFQRLGQRLPQPPRDYLRQHKRDGENASIRWAVERGAITWREAIALSDLERAQENMERRLYKSGRTLELVLPDGTKVWLNAPTSDRSG